MLDAFLLRVRSFPRADQNRYVAFGGNANASTLSRDREISFAGKAAVHLDKIGALVLLVVADGFCLIGSCNLNRLRPHRWVSINDGTRKIKVRSKDGFRGEFAPKFVCV